MFYEVSEYKISDLVKMDILLNGDIVDALARFAVPFFFLVSGYYSYQITCKKIKKTPERAFFLL